MFGYEGKGSAFALLQDKGWISSLSAGNRISSPDQTLFQVQMNLTADGEDSWKDVVKVIFDYVDVLNFRHDIKIKSLMSSKSIQNGERFVLVILVFVVISECVESYNCLSNVSMSSSMCCSFNLDIFNV